MCSENCLPLVFAPCNSGISVMLFQQPFNGENLFCFKYRYHQHIHVQDTCTSIPQLRECRLSPTRADDNSQIKNWIPCTFMNKEWCSVMGTVMSHDVTSSCHVILYTQRQSDPSQSIRSLPLMSRDTN